MILKVTPEHLDRVMRLWRLFEKANAPIRSITATTTACTTLGIGVLEKELSTSEGLVRPRRVIKAGNCSAGVYEKEIERCAVVARRFYPSIDSMGRPRVVSKHAVLRWSFEIGLDMFEQHFGVYGVPVRMDDEGIAQV